MGDELPLDEVLHVLADRDRRRLIRALSATSPQATNALHIPDSVTTNETSPERFGAQFYHRHLPYLSAIGVIEWDETGHQVHTGPAFERVRAVLERLDDTSDAAEPTDADSVTADSPSTAILLIEDNPGDIRLTKEAFNAGGIRNPLHVVTDGIEAIEFLHQRGEYTRSPRPAVVLIASTLPRKSGPEVLAEIKDDPALAAIPVIVLTSSESNEEIVRSHAQSADGFLTKPIEPTEFIAIIMELGMLSVKIDRQSG